MHMKLIASGNLGLSCLDILNWRSLRFGLLSELGLSNKNSCISEMNVLKSGIGLSNGRILWWREFDCGVPYLQVSKL